MKKLSVFLFFLISVFVLFCFTNKSFANETTFIYSLSLQSNNKILIGGNFTSYNNIERKGIARLNPDGSLDESFNPGTGLDGLNASINSILVQPDGKILISGWFTSYNNIPRKNIARLNQDGSLDESFNPGTGSNDMIFSSKIQSDGKILIVGRFKYYNTSLRNRVARINPDGSLDESFNPGTSTDQQITSVAIQPNGKIIINGWFTSFNNISKRYIARLNPNGSLDESFNIDINSFMDPITVLSDGEILVGKKLEDGFQIKKLTSEGLAYYDYDILSYDTIGGAVESMLIQSDGKIILDSTKHIMRLNTDGGIDENFQIQNLNYNYTSSSVQDFVQDIVLQSDGKILIGGNFKSSNNTSRNYIKRLNTNGSIDSSFNNAMNNSTNTPISNTTTIKIAETSKTKLTTTSKVSTSNNTSSTNLKGKLLLATEDHGRIWYVDLTGKRHEVTFENALELFKKLSLGISDKDLSNIPLNTENKTSEIGNRQKGRLLLATEDHGRIWYVDLTGKRHEVTFANLMTLFTKLSLGISNVNLSKISEEKIQIPVTNSNDLDNDGLTNQEEINYKTDPKNKDTDGDGYLDGDEIKNGYDPLKSDNAKLETPDTGKEAELNDKGSTLKSIGNQIEDNDIQLLSWDWMSSNRKDLTPEQNKEILIYETSLRRTRENLIGLRYGIGDFFNLSPTSTVFKNEVYINIVYKDEEIKGINENELSIYSEDENGQWTKVSSTINLASNTITAKITGAGTYTAGAPFNPDKIDSDNDGLTDSEELNTNKTSPDNPDTDEDGYLDGDEIKNGYDPLKKD